MPDKKDFLKIIDYYGLFEQLKYFQSEVYELNDAIYEKADIFIIFCGQNQLSEIFNYFNDKQKDKKGTVRQLFWCKTNPSPMNGEYLYLSGIENAVWFKKKGTGKINCKCKKKLFYTPIWQ